MKSEVYFCINKEEKKKLLIMQYLREKEKKM